MRLMLHSLEKDLRRLWPLALVALILLANLAMADRWRQDVLASQMEGWMNLLLTFAWGCLAALAVLEEPLVGTRNFWTTRPYQWPSLLAAKISFVLIAIQLPSFLADLYILSARGFSPFSHLPALLSKQALFFAAVILPSLAVATVVSDFTHFVIAAFVTSGVLVFLNGGFGGVPDFARRLTLLNPLLACLSLSLFAAAVTGLQYARPRLAIARALVITAAFTAACIYLALPASASYSLRSSAAEPPTIRLRRPSPDDVLPIGPGGRSVAIPLSVQASGPIGSSTILELELIASSIRMKAKNPSPNHPGEAIDLLAYMSSQPNEANQFLTLRFSNSAWERIRDRTLSVHALVGFTFTAPGKTIILQRSHESTPAAQLGRCMIYEEGEQFQGDLLKVYCESPESIPNAWLVLHSQPSGREWRLPLNQAFTYAAGPRETWLTPLHRAQTFFRLTGQPETSQGNSWQVPKSYLSSYQIEITPEIVTGHALAEFNSQNVNLSSFARR
jgi:hypothetical protein